MPGLRDAAATARGRRESAVPDVPCAPGQPVPRSLQEIILIPEGDAEPSPLSLPAPGCSQPVPQAFPRSAAAKPARAPVISCQRPRRGLLRAAPRPAASAESPARAKNLHQRSSRWALRCPASPKPRPVAGHSPLGWHPVSLRETRLVHEQRHASSPVRSDARPYKAAPPSSAPSTAQF